MLTKLSITLILALCGITLYRLFVYGDNPSPVVLGLITFTCFFELASRLIFIIILESTPRK